MSTTEGVKDATVAAESAPAATETAAATTPEDWKAALKIPPKDTRVKTEVIGGDQDFLRGGLSRQHPGIGEEGGLGF